MARNTLFTDNTTRADNADLGAVWDPYTGSDAGRIDSNLIKPASIVNFAGQEAYNGTIPANDQWASINIQRITNGNAYVNAGVICRYAAPSTHTGYLVAVQINDIFIGKMTAGAFTSLASAAYTVPSTAPNIDVSLEVVGTGLEGFIDLVSKVSTTDASVSSGRTGISWYIDTGGTNNDINLTNFAMGDFSGGGGFNASWARGSNSVIGAGTR